MKRLTTICTVWFLMAGPAILGAQTTAQAGKLLESARHKEVMEGDLKAAIEQYRKIAAQFAGQPEIAARALYQLGQCQEKLGQAEARRAYERIVRDYSGAQQYAAMARSRLAAMGTSGGGEVRNRLLWDNAVDFTGSVTSDGRYFCHPEWSTGDLGLRDLVAGQGRRVTDKGGYEKAKGEVDVCAISPDGKQIAFTWYRFGGAASGGGSIELRVVGADGKNERVILDKGQDVGWAAPFSWSPDQRWVAAQVNSPSQEWKLMLLSPDGESAKTLLTTSRNQPSRITFSPDGKWLAFNLSAAQGRPTGGNLYTLPADGSGRAPTEIAVDAGMMGWTPDGKALLFTREFNGVRSLYLAPVANGKANGEAQLVRSATGIGDWPIGITSQGALIHGVTKRTTTAVTIPLDSNGAVAGAPQVTLPIAAYGLLGLSGGVRYSPDGKHVLFTTSEKTILVRSLSDGSEYTMMPQLSRMGRVEWAADSGSLFIAGSTSDGKEGIFQVGLRSGSANLLLGGQMAWVFTSSSDGRTLFYRKGAEGIVAHELKTGTEHKLMDVKGPMIDLKVSRDGKKLAVVGLKYLRIVDIATSQVQPLFESEDPDTIDPQFQGGDWSCDGRRFFVFPRVDRNRRTELWTFPASGGEPIRQKMDDTYRGVWAGLDGRHLATIKWEQVLQIWSLENFLTAK